MSSEESRSGTPIYRHEHAAAGSISAGDPALIAEVQDHVTAHFGEPTMVFHELVSQYVHIDIHVVPPTGERPVFTLVTSGMSEQPMHSPTGDRFAELMIVLPPTWPAVGSDEFEQGAPWPYTLLPDLARLPHAYETVLWSGHTVPNGDPPEPYAPDTELCGALIAPPVFPGTEGFETLELGDRTIHFFAVWPLHADEMKLKLDKGLEALYELLDAAELTEILDHDRPSVVPPRRKWFRR
jgi:hypothetical protein